jgi:hypothetical protein
MEIKFIVVALLVLMGMLATSYLNNLRTGSMPCFQQYSQITMDENYPFWRLQIGDVICYKPTKDAMDGIAWVRGLSPIMDSQLIKTLDGGNSICHRVSYVGEDFVITKADVSLVSDPFRVHAGEYGGKVVVPACYESN